MSSRQELHERAAASLAEVSSFVPFRRDLRRRLTSLRDDEDAWEQDHPNARYDESPYRAEIDRLARQSEQADADFNDVGLLALGHALLALSAERAS